jgi:actin-related protein
VALSSKASRENVIQFQFETFKVSSRYVGIHAVLSLNSSGWTTGIAFNESAGVSHMVAIGKGSSLPRAVTRLNPDGHELTAWLHKTLDEGGYTFTTSAEREIVRNIKEKQAYVALDFEPESQKAATTTDCNVSCTLPDGNEVVIANRRLRCSEQLFRPSFNGFEFNGID